MTHRPSPPEGTPRHLTAAFLQLEWADLGTVSGGLIRPIQRPPRPQVQSHRRHQVPPRLQESRKTITMTQHTTGFLTPCRESATDTPTRLSQHLSCGKARPAAPTAAANCRQLQQWTTDLDARLAEHAAGRGARLLEVVKAAGIGWTLARTWPGSRTRERQIKNQGGASRHCPECGVRPRQARGEREVQMTATDDTAAPDREDPGKAGYLTAQQIITAQANAGMTAEQIEAHHHDVAASLLNGAATPEGEAFAVEYSLTGEALVSDLRADERGPEPDRTPGAPHPDARLAERGWRACGHGHGVYVRRQAQAEADADPEAA